ncbi:hypothetical protein H072_5693 [Dactylellina haptotyla CBS 200.50]|uniref:Uncharacterized protein n=1 Tax=Dactylellina haptotyla (strain CBS 200.50) TaxID=1284197 RepID=S8AH30_DACHA|nr:hypothetical protein H072_5693 [Dactylellina haptotyla CBS 200.50]
MPFALHTFLAPRKPDFFPPLPGLPTYSASNAAPSLFEDLGLEDDIVFDEVFLDIMGLNETATPPRHSMNEPVHVPRSDSIVAPLLNFTAQRKASLANCLAMPQASPFELKNIERLRQTRSKSVSTPSAYYKQNKPLPLLPTKGQRSSENWSSSPSVGFTNYSMPRKMSTPNRFLNMNFSASGSASNNNNSLPLAIPQSPLSPKQLDGPSSL